MCTVRDRSLQPPPNHRGRLGRYEIFSTNSAMILSPKHAFPIITKADLGRLCSLQCQNESPPLPWTVFPSLEQTSPRTYSHATAHDSASSSSRLNSVIKLTPTSCPSMRASTFTDNLMLYPAKRVRVHMPTISTPRYIHTHTHTHKKKRSTAKLQHLLHLGPLSPRMQAQSEQVPRLCSFHRKAHTTHTLAMMLITHQSVYIHIQHIQ